MTPQVTVAIATRNRADLLPRAIGSALAQADADVEVIVADNASSDGTPEVRSRFTDSRLAWLRHEADIGMTANWNSLLGRARGEYFVLLSDDDTLETSFVAETTACRNAAFAYSAVWVCRGEEAYVSRLAPPVETGVEYVRNRLLGRRATYLCGTLFRTESLRKIGGFPMEYGYAPDSAVCARLAFQGDVAHVPKPLARYTDHPAGLTYRLPFEQTVGDDERLVALCVAASGDLRRLGRSYVSRQAALRLLARAQAGGSKRDIVRDARMVPGWSPRTLACVVSAVLLPPALIRAARRAARLLRSRKGS